jgi:uncharacterized membrane protein
MMYPSVTTADLGVGVSLGDIAIQDSLSPGGRYRLPSLAVINTGDVQSDYGIRVSFQHNQSELRPPQAWLDFSPQRFPLEPNQSQAVSITLTIPTNAEPGDYFAFLEAHPIIERKV